MPARLMRSARMEQVTLSVHSSGMCTATGTAWFDISGLSSAMPAVKLSGKSSFCTVTGHCAVQQPTH
jgi:hypothetical protein